MSKNINFHRNINTYDNTCEDLFTIIKTGIEKGQNKHLVVHRHPYHEIMIILEGELTIEVDFKEYIFKRGSLCLISPLQVHYPKKESKDFKGYLIKFYSNIFDNISFFKEINIFEYDYIKLKEHHLERIRMLLNELDLEFQSSLILKDYVLGNLLKCIFITIQRAIPEVISQKSCNDEFSKLNTLIVENKFRIAKPSEYANKLRISQRTLNAITKKYSGVSSGEYIRSKTIFEAQRLLCYTTLTIKEIAYSLGFDDTSYFSRFFKKATGLSPLYHRENYS